MISPRKPLKHAKSPSEERAYLLSRPPHNLIERRVAVTVCVACLFNWIHGENDIAHAVVTASDRQITSGDVEYEPNQVKVCFLTKRVLILISGDYAIHSEALMKTQSRLLSDTENSPGEIAEIYASYIRDIKFRYACNVYLSPLGLTSESFYSRQSGFEENFLHRIANQLQEYQAPLTEAIIAGADDRGAEIYLVDTESKVNCQNDVGFVAIGAGAWHAKSLLMQSGYNKQFLFPVALWMSYAAKKRGEIATGVGKATDIFYVTRDGWIELDQRGRETLTKLYMEAEAQIRDVALTAIRRLGEELVPHPTAKAAPYPQSTTWPTIWRGPAGLAKGAQACRSSN